jgi:hypothetical protein
MNISLKNIFKYNTISYYDGLTFLENCQNINDENIINNIFHYNTNEFTKTTYNYDTIIYLTGRINHSMNIYKNMDLTRLKLIRSIIRVASKIPSLNNISLRAILSLRSPLLQHQENSTNSINKTVYNTHKNNSSHENAIINDDNISLLLHDINRVKLAILIGFNKRRKSKTSMNVKIQLYLAKI